MNHLAYDHFTRQELIMRALLILIVAGTLLGGCALLNQSLGLPPDNPLEEAVEIVIKTETGLEIDLTPDSAEK